MVPAKVLSDFTQGRDNNLNLVRFVLSVAVIYSHSFPLSLGKQSGDFLSKWCGVSLGDVAVNAFFVISGFLVAASMERSKSVRDYAIARIARIYPGLWIALLFCAIPIGLSQCKMETWDYLLSKETRNFVIKNGLLIPGKMQFTLPSVFNELPYESIVNGSLWTLPYEVCLYVAIACLGWQRGRILDVLTYAILAVTILLFVGGLVDSLLIRLAAFGAFGVLAYRLKDRIWMSNWIFVVCCLAVVLLALFQAENVFQSVLCSYVVLWIGFVPRLFRGVNKLGTTRMECTFMLIPFSKRSWRHFLASVR